MGSAIFGASAAGGLSAERSRLAIEQATLALLAGDHLEAERTLRNHVLQAPDDADAFTKLAELVMTDHRLEEATLLLKRAATADPSPPRHFALARHLLGFAGPSSALAHIQSSPAPVRTTFGIRALEAVLLGMLGKHDLQLQLYEKLTAERPSDPVLWINMATPLNAVGRVEDAVAAIRTAIRLERNCGAAYWALANLKSRQFSNSELAAMRHALRRNLSDYDRLHFEFALGSALEQRRAYAESFEHYSAGNRIRSATLEPEQMRVTSFVDEAIATFDDAFFKRRAATGCKAHDPIFIIGLHRSGSTLVEQILASHPRIEGAGELPVMQQIWDRISRAGAKGGRSGFDELSSLIPTAFEAIGSEYLERTRPFRSTDRDRFVDKLPANWLNAGLIRLALPNARIVDVRRNPMACGFSNFKQHYAIGVNYAYSLESIGRFYRDYLRLMNHFDLVQPGAIHHVIYEKLVENPQQEVGRVLDFLGLPFDPLCLDFHRNERAVTTPSAEQVRQPINRDGLDAWRAYEPWLGPLEEALGPAMHGWLPAETG